MSGTPGRDVLRDVLAALGASGQGDDLVALDAAVKDTRLAAALVERLAASGGGTSGGAKGELSGPARGRALLALGSAQLARRDANAARATLERSLADLDGDPRASGRARLRLAAAEAALGRREAAREAAARALVPVLAAREPALLEELGAVLAATGQSLDAALDQLKGALPHDGSAERLAVLVRLLHALNSTAGGTTEPLYAVVRAALEQTQGDRAFLMVYDTEQLHFELGLARTGHRLGPADFELSTTIVESTLETGRCVIVPDIERSVPLSAATSARELGLRAAVCIPLRVERRRPGAGAAGAAGALPHVRNVAGVLYVDSKTPGRFKESDASFFEVLGDGAVLALRARAAALRPQSSAAGSDPLLARGEPDPDLARRYPEIVTRDAAMKKLLALVDRVGPSDANVLVRGESGTGKELLARALHRRGLRAERPFVVVECGALHEDLAASELFGHEKDAFTGASQARPGAFERANGGTLFLDEVGDLSLALQGSLLRVLQEGEVRRLGGDRVRRVDVRVVAATHRDLRAMVERGEFRHDLLFRLAVVPLRIPPLRERRGDLALLVRHLLDRHAAASGTPAPSIDADAIARLEEHAWPGNVRELENVLRAAALDGAESITSAAVDRVLGGAPRLERPGTIEEIERAAIAERLAAFRWNLSHAAKSLGIDRNTLRRKIVRHGIVRPDDAPAG